MSATLELSLSVDRDAIAREIAALHVDTTEKIRLVLEAIGVETIAYLRSLTAELRPPVHRGGPNRHAHPGHWADVTGNLANAYGYAVHVVADGAVLVLRNTMEYAAALEAKEGYFVLKGVTERDGPIDRALRHALKTIAPDWELVEDAA